jgi:anti-sigma factor RsiW
MTLPYDEPVNHLGDRISAFIDNELDVDARERVLVHLARCAECRASVEAERAIKARLGALARPDVPTDLATRLAGIGAGDQASRRPRHVVPRLRRRATGRRAVGRRRRVVAGSGAALAGALGAAFALGGGPVEGRPVTPNVNRFTVEHAVISDEVVPLTDRGGSAVVVSFTVPNLP